MGAEGACPSVGKPFATRDRPGHNGEIFERARRAKEHYVKRLQRRLARQQPASRNRAKTRQRIARLKGYGANVREGFAHKTSHVLVESDARVFAFEDLKLSDW